jgi:hypothetical protein
MKSNKTTFHRNTSNTEVSVIPRVSDEKGEKSMKSNSERLLLVSRDVTFQRIVIDVIVNYLWD